MIDRILNELTSLSLNILQWRVLRVLYDIHGSGQSLKNRFQRDIRDRLGIKHLTNDPTNDNLIHGILMRLRDEKYATHIDDSDAPANQVDKWQITKKGIEVIERS